MTASGPALMDEFVRGTQFLRAGRCTEALSAFGKVYVRAQAAGDTDMMAAALCEMAWSCYRIGDADRGLECVMGARRLRERAANRLETARAMAVEAILLLDIGLSDSAFERASEALDLATIEDDPAMLAFAMNAKGIVLAVCHEPELGANLVERAVGIANHQSNAGAVAYYLLNLGVCHARMAEEANTLAETDRAMGEREAAIEFTAAAIEHARQSGDLWTLRVALSNNAEMLASQGNFDAALALLEQCDDLLDTPGTGLRIQYLYTLGDVLFRAGRLDEARSHAAAAVSMADATNLVDHQVNAVAKLAEILEALGDAPAALAQFKRFHQLYVRQSGATTKRRAHIESIRSETALWRNRAALLADQALSDPLTGIANRRSFDQILGRLARTPFCVAIVDLDCFKSVNDRFSHIIGDAVLQRVAAVLVDELGPHGHAARLGGEEFALVLPNMPKASAITFCEGIRLAIAAIDWSYLGKGLEVTVSIGLANGDGKQDSDALLQLADSRLYAAKAGGRNRVQSTDAATQADATPDTREQRRA